MRNLYEFDKTGRLESLQVLRAIAILMVCFYHVYIISCDANYYGSWDELAFLAEPGKFGVNLFFVLSGFVIFYAHYNRLEMPNELRYYALKRIVRIYPIYWVFLTMYVLASYFGLGYPDFSWGFANMSMSYFLFDIYGDATLPLKVAWTLCYEIFFYAAFSFFIFSKKLGFTLFFIWLFLIVFFNFSQEGAVGIRILEVWNLYFFAGALCYFIYSKFLGLSREIVLGLIVTGILSLILLFSGMNYNLTPLDGSNKLYTMIGVYGFSCVMLLFLVLYNSKISHLSFLRRIFIYVGDASYSIYLTHSAIMSVSLIMIKKLFGLEFFPHLYVAIFMFFFSILIGVCIYRYLEKPLIDKLGSYVRRVR